MVHPTYKKQEQIENKILEYLKSARQQSWSQLYQKAKKDGISKPTLSRYLKEFERKALVAREVDTTHRPPKPFYAINMPPPPPIENLAQWLLPAGIKQVRREWEEIIDRIFYKDLPEVDDSISHAKTKDEKADMLSWYLYRTFHIIITDLAALHVWASKFPKECSTTATEYMDIVAQDFLAQHFIGGVAPLLIKHQEIVQDAIERLLQILFMSRGAMKHPIPQLRPYLEWKPNISFVAKTK
jgi:hypothetical protein